jgi:uncharacterized membrane protein YkvA (DUF1232 family)
LRNPEFISQPTAEATWECYAVALHKKTSMTGVTQTGENDEESRAGETNVGVQSGPEQSWGRRGAGALKTQIGRFFKQFRVIRRALKHPQVPWYAKAGAGCAVAYVLSPIQIIPNFIPVIGQMDDVLVITLAIKFLRRCVPPQVLEECENESPAPVVVSAIPAKPVTNPLPSSKS